MNPKPTVSVVIPCHNEEGSLPGLLGEIDAAFADGVWPMETVVCDDGSSDETWRVLQAARTKYPWLRAVRHDTNHGQSAAIWSGIRASRGEMIATLDGDGQSDPKDLLVLLEALTQEVACVCGDRSSRRRLSDGMIKRFVSRSANRTRRFFIGDPLTDGGCPVRVFRRDWWSVLPFFTGVHRFVPALIHGIGGKVVERPIDSRRRSAGTSHYGLFDRNGTIPDLLAVRWWIKRHRRPIIAQSLDGE